ncbi:MAG: hypothetical protein IT381_05800 [Deltaproteobacteria bacterium]|nr:hypothetical protein [Deltaproteobacteria bacterium]
MKTWIAWVVLALLADRALAQCRADVECKGDRICVHGECQAPAVSPLPSDPQPAPPEYAQPPPPPPPSMSAGYRGLPGWSLGAGIFGTIMVPTLVGLLVASELTKSSAIPSLPLGAAATIAFISTAPIVAAGARSVRQSAQVRGVVALQVIGWIFYGLTIAQCSALVVVGAIGITPPEGVIASTAALTTVTYSAFAVDAFVSRAQAKRVMQLAKSDGVRVLPIVAVARTGNGGTAPTLGLGGTF